MKVILAIDGSPHSQAAAVECSRQPWPHGTEVEVLTVIHASVPLFMEVTLVLAAAHVEEGDRLRRHAPALVDAASKLIRDAAPAVSLTTKILEGDPKDMIIQEAKNWDADLVVLGSHGYGRVRRMVLGSVAGAVVAGAPCSVLVVRAKHLLRNAEPAP
jgi:nucleotide-binding universal stress UspA family protein